MKYEAKNAALQELVKLLLPAILEELNMEEIKPQEEKTIPEVLPEEILPEIMEEPKKPKGMSLSITELGLMGKPKEEINKEVKKKRGKPAKRKR